ncbi:pilus (MSHA type) biogenesis protein MshL [Desulfolithobacter sp.]
MKVHTRKIFSTWLCCIALLYLVSGCTTVDTSATSKPDQAPTPKVVKKEMTAPTQLPVRFQRPSFVIEQETADVLAEDSADYAIKVGANINSTRGPQPLWDILKRLANLKGMSVSWASDVDQNVKVDVNISADDDYFKAIDNLLRQVDYFHEVHDNTIIVKYKETKRFHLSIPYMKGSYTTTVGGNFLTNRNAATGTEGTVKITSDDNTFDVWENIQANLDTIMQQWQINQVTPAATTDTVEAPPEGEQQPENEAPMDLATRSVTSGEAYYTIDRNVGLITVTAPRTVLEKVENYLSSLKKELYRQVIIEAKIIEVYLQDNSKVGIDWNQVLKSFPVTGQITFGDATGQIYPATTSFVSKVALSPVNFTTMLNALNEQGDAHVLSNPKITVLNGQPALISVGKDITYLKSVSKDIDNDAGTITYTAETDNIVEGISLGVVATILDDDSVILHLTPITTDLIDDTIQYEVFGNEGLKVGVPKVGVRQMSTMVQVDNGEMLIIGGLIDKVKRSNEEFAPVVGDIPILKYLFGYEEKIFERRELVILLTPKII